MRNTQEKRYNNGFPMYAVIDNKQMLCFQCAGKHREKITSVEINWNIDGLHCEQCGKVIVYVDWPESI